MTSKRINTIEKKLKFHCSTCSTTWQLIIVRTDLISDENTKCLNRCSQKWENLLIAYCRERQIIYFANKEQDKDDQHQDLANWLKKLHQQNHK